MKGNEICGKLAHSSKMIDLSGKAPDRNNNIAMADKPRGPGVVWCCSLFLRNTSYRQLNNETHFVHVDASFFKSKTDGDFGVPCRRHHHRAKWVNAQLFIAMAAILGLLMSCGETHCTSLPSLCRIRSRITRSSSHASANNPTGGRLPFLPEATSLPSSARLE